MRLAYRIAGLAAAGLGAVGLVVPLLPTVPFLLLAAYCFARSNPAWEQWLLDHPRFGPHIKAWRASGSISRRGKAAALLAFGASAATGIVVLEPPWNLVPAVIGLIGSAWILTRPTAHL